MLTTDKRSLLTAGTVIPAHPLALSADRTLDERRQRALTRYYLDAGVGGVAVAVHTTQFQVHEPERGLLEPVLRLAAAEIDAHPRGGDVIRIVGVTGSTAQAVAEAELAGSLGYDVALVSPGGQDHLTEDELIRRSSAVGEVLPTFGFYLQESVGGRVLSTDYWRRLADLPSTVGVKAAPFDRYRTMELVRGVVQSRRGHDIALYTGNDDNIVGDLVTPLVIDGDTGPVTRRFVGGLLGHWAVWTRSAVRLHELVQRGVQGDGEALQEALRQSAWITEANAAVFDVRNRFRGVIAGVHEALRLLGLLQGAWCLDPRDGLSPGQASLIEAIDASPWLADEKEFVAANLSRWMR